MRVRVVLAGIHHVKMPVTDLDRSRHWYGRVLGFKVTHEFQDADGVVRGVAGEVPGLGDSMLCLRVNSQAAQGCQSFDPVSFAVRDRADIEASIGWLLVFNDPDGLDLHLYSWAAHGVDHGGVAGYGRPVS
ncbi:VOC family protein [Streptomyces sp. NPDC050508]|uniref:VOC family protein n=1 Tax=Streptomyces sp. NPDC050508 TaxID=3155405 RepID=UPI003428B41D